MVTNTISNSIVSSPNKVIGPLPTLNYDIPPTSILPVHSGTPTTSTSYHNIMSSFEQHNAVNTLTILNSATNPVPSSYSLTPATVGIVSAVPSDLLSTSTSHHNIMSSYEQHNAVNTLTILNSATNPGPSSYSLTPATVGIVSAVLSSLLSTSTSHHNIMSSYEQHNAVNTLTVLNSASNPGPSSYSLTPATVGIVSAVPSSLLSTSTSHHNIMSSYEQHNAVNTLTILNSATNPGPSNYSLTPATVSVVSATMNVPSSVLATSTSQLTTVSNNAVGSLMSNPASYPTITSSYGATPSTVNTVDLMSGLVGTSSHHTTMSNNELDAESVLDSLSGMDDLYGWENNLIYNDHDFTEGTIQCTYLFLFIQ